MKERELIVVGAGPAGMAAALAASEAGVKDILLIERDRFLGGILNQCIHTGFGVYHFKELLTGPEYASRFIEKVRANRDIELSLSSFAVKLTAGKELTFLRPGSLQTLRARALIMATGCRERTREMIHIPGTRPAGIFSAGLAQKLINVEGLLPGREVVIIGSGDIGLIMARRFILEGAKVKAIIEVRGSSRGLMRNVVQCVTDFGIPMYFNHAVSRIYGRDRVEKVDVVKVDGQGRHVEGSLFTVYCDTILISVGLIPENELIEMAGAVLDPLTNCPVSDQTGATSISGVFACGNSFKVYDLVDSVTKDSFECGRMAARYLGRLK